MVIGINGYIGSGKDTIGTMIQYHQCRKRYGYNPSDEFRQDSTRDYSISGWYIKKFAGKLKQIVSILTGIPVGDLERQDIKNSYLGEEWNWIHKSIQQEDRKWILVPGEVHPDVKDREKRLTVRELLQKLGTEACRNVIHENIWVNALFADYQSTGGKMIGGPKKYELGEWPNWIITDTRFPNEAKAIKNRDGLIIRINRPYKDGDFISKPHSSETSLDNYKFDYILDNNGTKEELLEKVKIMMDDLKLWDNN